MKLISRNIQWCRGMDGRVDPARIARVAKELCDPDVCCFQEVAENYPSLAGSSGENQFEFLKDLFASYSAHIAYAVDAWRSSHPGKPHPPSFGLFDKQFAREPYCCDFAFVSRDLVARIASVRIDSETQASDHQPVIVTFA